MKKKVFRWTKLILIVYSLLGIVFYYGQERIFFHPQAVAPDSSYRFSSPYNEINIPLDTAGNIHIVCFTVPDSLRKGIVLYFHGNRKNVSHYAGFANGFIRRGYEVWMPDYPGFGKSTGKLSEQALYDEALQVYKLLRTRYSPEQILIYGKSMGSGVAAELASIRDCRRLILETPYYSMQSLAQRYLWLYPTGWMLRYRFPTYRFLAHVTAPITIFHGTADEIIPYSNAAALQQQLKAGDAFITIPGGRHNDLNDYPLMQHILDSLLP